LSIFKGDIADLKLTEILLDLLLFLLVVSVPATSYDNNDDGSNEGADGGPDEDGRVHAVVIIALGVLPLVVVVPLGAVSVEVAALPGAVLVGAALVVAHYFFDFGSFYNEFRYKLLIYHFFFPSFFFFFFFLPNASFSKTYHNFLYSGAFRKKALLQRLVFSRVVIDL